MAVSSIITSSASGELSPELYGRVDLDKWHAGLSVCRNMVVNYKGGAYSRGGTAFVGVCKQAASASSNPPRNIEFTFSIFQSYVLEFGDNYMRVIANGAYVTEAPLSIASITNANPAVMTVPGNGYSSGDWLYLTGTGMPGIENQMVVVENTGIAGAGTFSLQDVFGAPISSLTFPSYPGGGTAARIYTLPTPYAAIDLPYLKFTQSKDVMSLCLVNQQTLEDYLTQELTRFAANDWTIAPPQFESSIGPPASCSASASVAWSTGPGPAAYGYVVTAVDVETGEESIASPIGAVINSVDIAGQFGTITVRWSPVAGAGTYNVYRAAPDYTNQGNFAGQLFYYVGSSATTSWQDTNVVADFTTSPPQHTNPFANGVILSVTMNATGSGYSQSTVSYTLNSAQGSGADLAPVVVGGAIVAVTVEEGGENYQSGDTIIFNGQAAGSGAAATFTASGTDGAIETVTVNNGGSRYSNPTVTAPGGIDAVFVPIVEGGVITAIYWSNSGSGYGPTGSLTITDSSPGGVGASATLSIGPESGNNPGVVAYFQQRRAYACTINEPDTYFLSQPGAFLNFDSANPPIDSDAITGSPWASQVNAIQNMVPMPGGLVIGTGKDAWQLSGTAGAGSPITPSQQNAQPQESIGFSAILPPIKTGYNILYGQALGSIVRELNYNFYFNIYAGTDMTVLSSHLFQGHLLREWAWAQEPYKVCWAVRDDGRALSLTYLKDENVRGWARHDTNGLFVSVTTASEPPVNAPYFIAKRFIAGRSKWIYVQERMDDRIWPNVEATWCVDSGLALTQPAPQATLEPQAAQGSGGVVLQYIINGGTGYTAPAGQVVDRNGVGSGAEVISFTLSGGVILDVTLTPGVNYQAPQLVITDATGIDAVIELAVDNTVVFITDSPAFGAGDVGKVLRAGGGIGTVTQYINPTQVYASVPAATAITDLIPNDPYRRPAPVAAGDWTLTAPVSTVSGLNHLEGMLLDGLCDGGVVQGLEVVNGEVALPNAASQVTLGLPFLPQFQTLHAEVPGAMVQGMRKRIPGVTVRLFNSRGVMVGQDQPIAATQPNQAELPWNVAPNLMTEISDRRNEIGAGNAIPLFTGDRFVRVAGDFNTTDEQPSPGMVALQQTYPLPMEVLAIIPKIHLGDKPNA